MKLFWRRKMEGKHRENHDIEESEQRLKQTEERWNEVHQATHRLERLIQDALRGGAA